MRHQQQVAFISAYIPPSASVWCQTTVSPLRRLREVLTICEVRGPIILLGDLNARLRGRASHLQYPRVSPDMAGNVNSRSKEVLDLCTAHNLVIANGTHVQTEDSLPRLSSFQYNGNALVDYAVISDQLLENPTGPRVLPMAVHPHLPLLADHAAISVACRIEGPHRWWTLWT